LNSYRLSDAADRDLLAIAVASEERFGINQATGTINTIEQQMEWLGENPGLGHRRDDLTPDRDIRYWTVLRRFVILYRPAPTPIRIVRIVDGARDIPAILRDTELDDE